VKVALLGLGSAGARHAANLIDLGTDVTGWDPDPDRHAEGVTRSETVDAALAGADAAVVASPNTAHASQALAALEAGVPVLVEKPLAVTSAEALEIAEFAERRGVLCAVAMNLRFHPAILALRELIGSGELGRVLFASASFGYDLRRWRPDTDYRRSYSARAELGGGIVLDAIHELDYLLWLLGPVQSVSAVTAHVSDLEIDVEDTAVAALTFASGAVGALDLNFVEQAYRRGCVIAGDRASARWDWTQQTVVVASPERTRTIDVTADVAETYRAEVEDFLAVVSDGGAPRTSAAEGLAAVRLAEALKASAADERLVEL
jgi:predicted dehydrogenase